MQFNPTLLKGLFVIEPKPVVDARGSFARVFCEEEFSTIGYHEKIVQINHSVTKSRGAIRGLHFQKPPFAEVKIIKCLRGKVFDVAVDIRQNSPTFLQWFAVELSAEKMNEMYIPKGFAHGFQTLEENSELLYLHTQKYAPNHEGAIRFDDPRIAIKWPLPIGEVSDRDKSHPLLEASYQGISV